MSRNEKELKEAIDEIQKLREDFYKNVYVPGTNESFNEPLAKALESSRFFRARRAYLLKTLWTEQNLVEDTLGKSLKHQMVKPCVMIKILLLFRHGSTKAHLVKQNCIKKSFPMKILN